MILLEPLLYIYIDDFIWIPDFMENLLLNITLREMKWKMCISTTHNIGPLRRDTKREKMYTQPAGKPMRAVT